MGCIQAYFRKAQSGLSPSSTLDNEAPEVITEENVSGRISEKVSCSVVTEDDEPTEDDDPDKSQGVRATAVLSLAASTGTVAILGTTAQRIPSDVSETTLNTLQNLELEQDSFISNLDPATEKHIPLRDKDTVDASQEAVEEEKEPPNKLIEYTEEPKRIFSEKLIPNNTIAESTLSSTTVSLADEERGVPEVTVTLTSESSVDVESDGGITSEAHDESSTATEVLHLLADDGQAGEETSEHDTTTTKSESSPLVVQAIELEERSSTADSDVTMQKEAISDAHRTDRDVSDTSISIDETSGDVTKATHTAGLTNDYNLIENEDSSESFETYSLGLGTKLQFEEQKIPKPEDQKKLVQIEAINQKLVREASDDEMPTTVLELTKDIVRADEALDKLLIDSPKTLVSCEFTKDRIVNGGVDVWREDNNSNIISKVNSTDKDVVNSILESNEYVERVKLKAEDLVNEICAQAETVNQNGGLEIKPETAAEQPQFIVSSVILSKANSVDTATRAGRPVSLSETKLRTSMTSSFEDALLNVNFGESATSDYSKEGVAGFCPRLSTIGSELELAPSFAERSSPDPESDFSDTDEESPDLPTGEELRKQLPESAVETIREEIDDICERAVERATQLANEKLAKKDDDSDSNEISENGTSTNNPSISLSEDTQILESNNTGILSDDAALTSAATTIQANFRGYQVRKAHKSKQDMPATESTIVEDDDLPPPDMDLLGSEGDTISEEDLPQPPEFDDLPLPEDLAELDDYVVTPEIRDQMQRRNTIIEQQRLLAAQSGASMASMAESASSTEVESSLSSAATKIQAGIRGYLTRKHLKNASSTTAPSMDDSDLSASGDVAGQDQIKKALSVEDTEIQRHPFSPPDDRYMAGKRMSLDSRLKSASDASKVRPPMRSVMSECVDDSSASAMEGGGRRSQGLRKSSSPGSIGLGRIGTGEVGGGGGTKGTGGGGGPGSADEEERAAACIQSSYRDYKSRQRLKRGDAMQMPTTSSSVTPVSVTPVSAVSAVSAANSEDLRDAPKHTGEYHDIIALSPPLLQRVLEEEPDAEDDSEKAEPPKTGTGNGGSGAKKAEESELIDAAIKIQSVYRGYKTRKDLDAGDSRTETESLASTPTEREPIKTVTSEGLPVPASQQQGAAGAGSATEDANSEDLNATKIQAAVRGFLTRKQLEEQKEAAVKIQGNFRKYNARKKGKSKK